MNAPATPPRKSVLAVIGQASPTLSKIAVAWQLGKPIIALPASGGWAERLAGEAIDARRGDAIHGAASAEEAVALAVGLAASGGVEPGDIGSGWRREATKAKGGDEGEGRG